MAIKPKVRLVLSGSALALILGINDGRVLGITYVADADVYEICVESKEHGKNLTEGAMVPRKDILVHGTCRYCGADTPLVEVLNDLPPVPREDDVPF